MLAAWAAAGVDVLYIVTGQSSIESEVESELIRRYRAAPSAVRAAVMGALFAGAAPAGSSVTISGGEQGQVVGGDAHQGSVTFNVGGSRKKRRDD